MRLLALDIAKECETVDISPLLLRLIETERNFKLAKGESTVELEKHKIDADQLARISEWFEKLSKAKPE